MAAPMKSNPPCRRKIPFDKVLYQMHEDTSSDDELQCSGDSDESWVPENEKDGDSETESNGQEESTLGECKADKQKNVSNSLNIGGSPASEHSSPTNLQKEDNIRDGELVPDLLEEEIVNRGRRRKRDPSSWKRNTRARKRLRGEEYEGKNGKVHKATQEGNPCNCKKNCFTKIDQTERAKIRNNFYKLDDLTAQRLFISNSIKCSAPKRRYAGTSSKRTVTFEYSVHFNKQNVSVCKQALASILGIKAARINYVCEMIKKGGTPGNDLRGKHSSRPNKVSDERRQDVLRFIDSIPKYRSHYTRRHNPNRYYLSPALTQSKLYEAYCEKCVMAAKEPVSDRMFKDIFTKERNYHFGQPSLDTCKICDQYMMQKYADPSNEQLENERQLHLRKAEAAQKCLKEDFVSAKENRVWTIAFDFQQTLPTPHINTSVTFYSRQLWTYNLGIHDINVPVMNMWSEDVAGRGSCEVISCLNRYFENNIITSPHLIAWSDSCGGQNKNKNMVSFWYYQVHVKKHFQVIVHKFPIPGHTFLPCDRDFGVIEKKKRKTPAVYTPKQWIKLVSESRTKNPFAICQMSQNEFIDISSMKQKLVFRNTAVDGSPVRLQKAMRIKIDAQHPGKYFIAYTHNQEEYWQEVNINKKGQHGSIELHKMYSQKRKIKQAKLQDLRKPMMFIPEQYRKFYMSLQGSVPTPRKLRNQPSASSVENPNSESESSESEHSDTEPGEYTSDSDN